MKGSEMKMLGFMEGADKRYVIPVYQRKYDWKLDNCRQLFNDLKRVVREKRHSHFFGSIVSAVAPSGSIIEYHIIDGQQRLTTVTLLLLALCNLIRENELVSQRGRLDEQISQRFLISPWAPEGDKIKLRPVKTDRDALARLFGDREDYDSKSNLTHNYQYFCDELKKREVSPDELFDAIGGLEIICITLDKDDNAQMIFESLNSTGLALQEGDKIRNYVLMRSSPKDQERFYEKYWLKIERCTNGDPDGVSAFIRDYLSVKRQKTPRMDAVYKAFKEFAEGEGRSIEVLLDDLLRYARLFEKLFTCESGLDSHELDNCLYRMKRLENTTPRPFLMEVLRLNQAGEIPAEDVLKVFLNVESYLVRRILCGIPSSSLNKVFLTVNREILNYDGTSVRYADKFARALLSKRSSSRFPGDEEFTEKLAVKDVYGMRGTYKDYLFERLENYGTVETKDVYRHLDDNTYTIEHIMPQHLSMAWKEALGADCENIYAEWLHRLANLTLTGYNSRLSNGTFSEKRDGEGGYRKSGLRMNQEIALKDSWGLPELIERNEKLSALAKEIWPCPQTGYVPEKKDELDSCTLDDESVDLSGRQIAKYSYLDAELLIPVKNWTAMFKLVVKDLHRKDPSVLTGLAYSSDEQSDISQYFSSSAEGLRHALKIDENIYVEANTNTNLKIKILHRLFPLYNLDLDDLTFYLRNES